MKNKEENSVSSLKSYTLYFFGIIIMITSVLFMLNAKLEIFSLTYTLPEALDFMSDTAFYCSFILLGVFIFCFGIKAEVNNK